jgi:hypothetical protein
MKSALLVAYRPDLFESVVGVLRGLSAEVSEAARYAQMADAKGRLLTVLGAPHEETLRSLREEENTAREGVTAPDMNLVHVCVVECRWEELFARFAREAARAVGGTCWVVDGDGVIWDAAHVDPSLVRL